MMRERFPYYVARVRMPLLWAFVLLGVADRPLHLPWWNWPLSLVLLVAGLACYFKVGTVRRPAIVVASPVAGRWIAINSPADRVPSHGVHAYGQTYAVDLVYPGEGRGWQAVHRWPPARRPETFPAFGQPVYAVADGVVVKAGGRLRDHWSRNSVPGLLYLLAEGNLREVLGPRFILGNYVVLDLGGGVYAAYAHLRRGSIRVAKGQRVTAGQQIAECGNSGNTSEPHVHFQLMDHRNVLFAAGLPFAFDRFEVDGGVRDGVPGGRRPFHAARAAEPSTAP